MKTLQILGNIVKWIIIVLILVFSLATFMGKAYGQTIMLWLIAATLAYWPKYFREKWNKNISLFIRMGFIVLLFAVKQIAFKSEPKTSTRRFSNSSRLLR